MGRIIRHRRSRRPRCPWFARRYRLAVEELEPRTLLSAAYTPAQVLHAYGLDQVPAFPGGGNGTVTANGSGQTIAVVDAYDNPTIANDLQTFDRQFNLPDPALSKVAGDGSAH